uniref:Uncharacterized protein n=1 Tax=Amphimedon queenslandica TaxID=400682 RepID=A0A1X7V3Y5_AMPQE
MPNFEEELFNSALSATKYSNISNYKSKSKMYRNYLRPLTQRLLHLRMLGISIIYIHVLPLFLAGLDIEAKLNLGYLQILIHPHCT